MIRESSALEWNYGAEVRGADEGERQPSRLVSLLPMQRVERDTASTGFHPGIFFGSSYGVRSCVNRASL